MADTPRTVEIVIPVYLSDKSLYSVIEQCLDTLQAFYPDIPLILVDDFSPLPLSDDWKKQATTYIHHGRNKGFTASVNAGMEIADSDVIIVANDDLTFSEGCLDRFYELEGFTIASPCDTASSPDDRFGAIWGITRKAYKVLGSLDERYVHYFSDLDYYDRAVRKGVEIVKWYDVILDHVESATMKTVDKDALFLADQEVYYRLNRP